MTPLLLMAPPLLLVLGTIWLNLGNPAVEEDRLVKS